MEQEDREQNDYVLLKTWDRGNERLRLFGRGEKWKAQYAMGARDVYKGGEYCYRLEFKPPPNLVREFEVQAVEIDMTETEALAWLEQPLRGWREFKRGCWLAAGATTFLFVVVPIMLAAFSLVMGVSLFSIVGSLGG